MSNILVKMPVKPHRQQVFWNKGGEEAAAPMKLQSWANKTAFAEGLVGEEAITRRDELMRQAVQDPKQFPELLFMSDPIPFDDDMQEAHNEAARAHEIEEEMTHGKDESEIDRQAIDDVISQELSSVDVVPRDDPGRVRREGPLEEGASASAPIPTGQKTLDDWMDDEKKTSFDPHPGDVMLKAIRARLGW